MKAVIKINMDNAAFDPEPSIELGRILREVADEVDPWPIKPGSRMILRDINGNTVGELKVSK